MPLSFSQGLCEILAGKQTASLSSSLAIVTSASGYDQVTDGAHQLDSFAPGWCEVHGAASGANNVRGLVVGVTSAALSFPNGTFAADQAAGAMTLTQHKLGTLRDLCFDSQLDWMSGVRPTTPDDAEGSAVTLVSFTGIRMGDVVWDSVNKRAYINLYGGTAATAVALADGTATWFRWRLGGVTSAGASTTAPRIDGSIGVGGTFDLQVSTTTIQTGATETLNNAKLRVPQSWS